jgi:hypothetical protein
MNRMSHLLEFDLISIIKMYSRSEVLLSWLYKIQYNYHRLHETRSIKLVG